MEVVEVLHMNGGIGETSYACNSSLQGKVISMALFPSQSLHFVHSLYSLHFLSQISNVPEGVESNKGNIYMAKTSPPSVLKAYLEQFERDFSVFLRSHSKELVPGGRMISTLLGRRSQVPTGKECCYIWELLAQALNSMVSEGLIEEEKVDTFNLPTYTPSPSEIKTVIGREGSFNIDKLETFEINWNPEDKPGNNNADKLRGANIVAKYMRTVAEPLLVVHFGEALMEEVFWRYREILTNYMSKEETKYTNVIVSMTRRK